jgi:ribose/xylose/arabinose/galactoside ABC-type transport system permease subunit
VPVLALAIQALFFAVLIAAYRHLFPLPLPVAHGGAGQSPQRGDALLVAANGILFLIGAIASTAAVAAAVARSEIGRQRFRTLGVRIVIEPYRFALLPATVAALAMAVTVGGVIGWGIVAHHVAPHAFTLGTSLIWLAIVGAMAVATLIAAIGVARGHAANALPVLTD